jgi:hypothetical protein
LNRFLLVALAVFVFSARGYVQVADTRYSLQTAERIVSSGHLDIAHAEGATRIGADGRDGCRNISRTRHLARAPVEVLQTLAACLE